MGTSYHTNISITSRIPKELYSLGYQGEYQKARKLFEKYDCTDCLDATGLVDTGKWRWDKLIDEVCATTHGLVISVHYVSDYGEARIDYYLSGVGFVYADVLTPRFDEKLAKKAVEARAAQERLHRDALARQEELRARAIKKLSPEERSALGIKAA